VIAALSGKLSLLPTINALRTPFSFGNGRKLLKQLERVFAVFSKCALKLLENQTDFDSAVRKLESSRPQAREHR
jgi:hypothetical protein